MALAIFAISAILFINSFCQENTATIASGEGFVMLTLPFQFAGMCLGGMLVDMGSKWGVLKILLATFACIVASLLGAFFKSNVISALGLCACNFFTSMLTIHILTIACLKEECTHVSFKLGVLAGVKTLGTYFSASSYPMLEIGIHDGKWILLCDAALLILAIILDIFYMLSSSEFTITSEFVSSEEEHLVSQSSSDAGSVDLEVSYDTDSGSSSSELQFSMDDIKKDLYPYRTNPALYIGSLCGIFLTGSLVPTSYLFFDPITWTVVLSPLVHYAEEYSQSIWY